MLNISVTEMPANVDDDVPKRRPSVVVAVALLAASRVSLRSLETLETPVRPDDTEIPESSESEPWREYEDLQQHEAVLSCPSQISLEFQDVVLPRHLVSNKTN